MWYVIRGRFVFRPTIEQERKNIGEIGVAVQSANVGEVNEFLLNFCVFGECCCGRILSWLI